MPSPPTTILVVLAAVLSSGLATGASSLAELISQIQNDEPRHLSVQPNEQEEELGVPTIPIQVDDAQVDEDTHHAEWMNSGKFQGDIAGVDARYGVPPYMSPEQDINDGRQYNAIRNRNLRWPDGIVPYVLATTYTPREKSVILRAMEKYHKETCIKFVPRSGQQDYLFIVKSYGCYSQVGRVRGRQELSLGNGCIYHEIAVHELMHALGFWHEHSRADRDQFIRIQWPNIIGGMRGQFDKISTAYQDFLGETYDYKSVMHYDSRAFSKNGQNTIETVKPGFTHVIGRAKDLSEIDIRKVNKLYQCPTQPTSGGGRKLPVVTFAPPTAPSTFRPRFITQPPRTRPPPTVVTQPPQPKPDPNACVDKFLDCPFFHRYCFRRSFFFIMKLYCPKTCGHCHTQGATIVLGPTFQQHRHRQQRRPQSSQRMFGSVFGSFLG